MKRHEATVAEGLEALRDHVVDKAFAAREAYGDHGGPIDAAALAELLQDSRFVRFPVRVAFGAARLQPGEFAYPEAVNGDPRQGYVLWVHPHFEARPDDVALLIAYHLVIVNYGDIADEEHAELYAATLLGMEQQTYYQRICALADEVVVV